MGIEPGEKLYRVKTKDGAHINEKIKSDGSRAAIQFDEENGLQGPVDLIEVDEEEYTRDVYVEVERKERSFAEIIIEYAIAPVVAEALTVLAERAIDAGVDALTTRVIPAVKNKGAELIGKAKESRAQKVKQKKSSSSNNLATTDIKTSNVSAMETPIKEEPVYHTREEVDQIIHNMQFAALYIAAGIRELSNTVLTETDDKQKSLEMEARLKELSSEQVLSTINFMLEDRNRDKLDQATLRLFEAFRNNNLIVDGQTVPISRYVNSPEE